MVIRDQDNEINNLKSRIEDLEKETIILSTKYAEARDVAQDLGADIKEFQGVGKLIENYLNSKSVVKDMDGKTIYKEEDK